MSNLLSKKVLFVLLITLPCFANAQSTHQLDSMLAKVITQAPQKDQANLEYIRTHYFDTLSISQTDLTDQKNLFVRFYYSFYDSSFQLSEVYYHPNDSASYLRYQKDSDPAGCASSIYEGFPMTLQELVTASQQSKTVAFITYPKKVDLTFHGYCPHGIKRIKRKQHLKQTRTWQLQKRYVVSIYRVNSVTKITVEVPPVKPKFRVKARCARYRTFND